MFAQLSRLGSKQTRNQSDTTRRNCIVKIRFGILSPCVCFAFMRTGINVLHDWGWGCGWSAAGRVMGSTCPIREIHILRRLWATWSEMGFVPSTRRVLRPFKTRREPIKRHPSACALTAFNLPWNELKFASTLKARHKDCAGIDDVPRLLIIYIYTKCRSVVMRHQTQFDLCMKYVKFTPGK